MCGNRAGPELSFAQDFLKIHQQMTELWPKTRQNVEKSAKVVFLSLDVIRAPRGDFSVRFLVN